jgi:hypothetical protein
LQINDSTDTAAAKPPPIHPYTYISDSGDGSTVLGTATLSYTTTSMSSIPSYELMKQQRRMKQRKEIMI